MQIPIPLHSKLTREEAETALTHITESAATVDKHHNELLAEIHRFLAGEGPAALGAANVQGFIRKHFLRHPIYSTICRLVKAATTAIGLGLPPGGYTREHMIRLSLYPEKIRNDVYLTAQEAARHAGRDLQASDIRDAAKALTAAQRPDKEISPITESISPAVTSWLRNRIPDPKHQELLAQIATDPYLQDIIPVFLAQLRTMTFRAEEFYTATA